jgi:hypothetical protein
MRATSSPTPYRTVGIVVTAVAVLQLACILLLLLYLLVCEPAFRSAQGLFSALVSLTAPLILLSLGALLLVGSSFTSVPSDVQHLTAAVTQLREQLKGISTVIRSQEEAVRDSQQRQESQVGEHALGAAATLGARASKGWWGRSW